MSTPENSTTLKDPLTAEKTPPQGFPWLEAELATRFGVVRGNLALFRKTHLTAGLYYTKHKREIYWSDDAVRAVAESLGMQLGELAWLAAEKTPPAVFTFTVLPRRTLNPHIIVAGPGEVRVRVKSKVNFRAGMQVQCTLVGGDLYELVGNCPRFPGKY